MGLHGVLDFVHPRLGRHRDWKVTAIRTIPTFAACDGAALEAVASVTTEVDLNAGFELAVRGRPQREVFVLLDGNAEAVRDDETIAQLRRGDPIGELEAVAGGSSRVTVRTTTPARALVISDRDFRHLVAERPTIASAVLAAVARRDVPVAA